MLQLEDQLHATQQQGLQSRLKVEVRATLSLPSAWDTPLPVIPSVGHPLVSAWDTPLPVTPSVGHPPVSAWDTPLSLPGSALWDTPVPWITLPGPALWQEYQLPVRLQ